MVVFCWKRTKTDSLHQWIMIFSLLESSPSKRTSSLLQGLGLPTIIIIVSSPVSQCVSCAPKIEGGNKDRSLTPGLVPHYPHDSRHRRPHYLPGSRPMQSEGTKTSPSPPAQDRYPIILIIVVGGVVGGVIVIIAFRYLA